MAAAKGKPNILVIWGDDIGVHNVSAYNHGVMGYRTPNIDRIASSNPRESNAQGQANHGSPILKSTRFHTTRVESGCGAVALGEPICYRLFRLAVPH
jgi:arylsulfatase